MGQPHKHAALIKAWADGAAIEFGSSTAEEWTTTTTPLWDVNTEYRIKPEEKKPVVRWLWAIRNILNDKRWHVTASFLSKEELDKEFGPNYVAKKLEYTRTEFPE